ncbi:NAD(P)H:quinone oxidoreductase, type IV [Kwoniella dejecticola CBS 10117]|uniref:NAD(P)H:quinone oxidoreductase, type IV n=1 Tax=Kwoniella dejecticola CBS 10117 TaxID=1296121 RepID=A0A1A6A6T9_9TREE|nr:NAD(P)H:quinone oxidoreductase, type IV [Kwoniella dejecticola CBS 10117]OBR85775.1 NAD(P)H:quinone oxidoreductase, type IV [Kwoniella dejecticola CBS 10117]
MYGHIDALATEIIKGVESTGAIVKPYVIQETLPNEVLTKMYANTSLQSKYPVITPQDLKEVDGLILGAPTRYGRLPAQVDAFFDQTGGLWASGALVGKFVTMFTSAAGQHSGHESTYLTTFPFFAHLAYVPIAYSNPLVGNVDSVQGSSPYGVSTIAGADGHLQPTANDLAIAQHQGQYFANFVGTFVKGKQATTVVSPTDAANSVPEKVAGEPTSTNGYNVEKGHEEATSTAAPAQATAESTPTAAGTPTPTQGEKKATPASAPAAPAKTAEKKQKKKGFFSCCDDSGIDK